MQYKNLNHTFLACFHDHDHAHARAHSHSDFICSCVQQTSELQQIQNENFYVASNKHICQIKNQTCRRVQSNLSTRAQSSSDSVQLTLAAQIDFL